MSSYYPIAGTRAPLLPAAPVLPIAGTRAPLLPKPKKAKAAPSRMPKATPTVALPNTQQSAMDQIAALLAPLFDQQRSAIQSNYDAQQSQLQKAFEALAQYSQGIGPAIQNAYQGASRDTAAFAKGFSDAVSQNSQGAANAATQSLAQQNSPQTVSSGLANGGADALYAMGGSIPASELAREGAAFSSAAAFLPQTAAGYGMQALSGLAQQRLSDLNDLAAQQTQDSLSAYNSLPAAATAKVAKPTQLDKVTLANGQFVYVNPYTGKAVTKPQGPVKTYAPKSAKPVSLQAKRIANGQYVTYDPSTGRTVGKPWGPVTSKKSGGSKSSGPTSLQFKEVGNYQQAWNPKTGQFVGPKYPLPKSTAATSSTKKGGFTALQRQKFTSLAYDSVLEAKNGVPDPKNPGKWILPPWNKPGGKRPKEVLQDLIAHGIPFDIAVRSLARVYPPAKAWYNPKAKGATGAQPTASYVLPTSWSGTHVSDGLGWGTKTAVDLFPGPPGTAVGAPESGKVLYFHPEGAQGGGSMEFLSDSGELYWIGHIEAGAPAGTRLKKGQRIASVAHQSVSVPHVHIDHRRYSRV